jgi:hypothetical protein
MPNLAFDLGHGPVSDPTIRRHHAFAHPPFIALPGAVPVNAGVRHRRGAGTWGAQRVGASANATMVVMSRSMSGPRIESQVVV